MTWQPLPPADLTGPPTLADALAFAADAREALVAALHKLGHVEMVLEALRAEACNSDTKGPFDLIGESI